MGEARTEATKDRLRAIAPGTVGFDWLYVAVSVWFLAGIGFDGRSHSHGAPESFFTVEHAVFYTAFLVIAGLIAGSAYRRRPRAGSWLEAVPPGYRVATLGIVAFGLGGFGDMVWHTVFGIEANVEALLSPTHQMLIFGGTLLLSGPLVAGWRREGGDWRSVGPAILAGALALALLGIGTLYAHPLSDSVVASVVDNAGGDAGISIGIAAILLQTAVLVGLALAIIRRFELPAGAFTVLLGPSAVVLAAINDLFWLAPAFLAGGVVADLLYRLLDPDVGRPHAWYGFAAAVPVALFASYFAVIALAHGIAWTVHVWAGAVPIAGVVGLAVAFVSLPADADRRRDRAAASADD